MKKLELKQIIREEIKLVLKETLYKDISDLVGNEYIHPKFGSVKVQAIRTAGSDFGRNKKDRVKIRKLPIDVYDNGKWMDAAIFLKLAKLI